MIKTERTQIHFLSDVLVAVASLDFKVPIVSMFCITSFGDYCTCPQTQETTNFWEYAKKLLSYIPSSLSNLQVSAMKDSASYVIMAGDRVTTRRIREKTLAAVLIIVIWGVNVIPRWRSEGRGRSLHIVGTIMGRAKSSVKYITVKIRNVSVVVSVHSTCWKR